MNANLEVRYASAEEACKAARKLAPGAHGSDGCAGLKCMGFMSSWTIHGTGRYAYIDPKHRNVSCIHGSDGLGFYVVFAGGQRCVAKLCLYMCVYCMCLLNTSEVPSLQVHGIGGPPVCRGTSTFPGPCRSFPRAIGPPAKVKHRFQRVVETTTKTDTI